MVDLTLPTVLIIAALVAAFPLAFGGFLAVKRRALTS